MSRLVSIRNRQKTRRVDRALLRRIVLWVCQATGPAPDCEICLHLVDATEMARVNKRYLNHEGSTDVITFDLGALADHADEGGSAVAGEIFISIDDAVAQARVFGTTWQSELARYAIHGVLHLRGHDDLRPAARRIMKREENRVLRLVAKQFPLPRLGKPAAARVK